MEIAWENHTVGFKVARGSTESQSAPHVTPAGLLSLTASRDPRVIHSHHGLSILAHTPTTNMADLKYTPVEEIEQVCLALPSVPYIPSSFTTLQIHASLQSNFKSGKAKDIKYRKHQLLQLAYLLKENRDRFNEAAKRDLGRSYPENEMYV